MNSTPEYKAECLKKWEQGHPDAIHHAHLMNLRGIPGARDRKAYIDEVERHLGKEHGPAAAQRLRDEYAVIWEARQKAKGST
jgi:hypothetical protein